jgi:hypothetical protein
MDYRVFDADNHYDEAPDAYTRHIDPAMARRAMQWADIDGRRRLLVGGKVNRFVPNPLFDPVAKPASDPVETLRAHVWVAPFYEDDLGSLKDDLGLDHLLFGSDLPHAEGLADPITFAEDLRRHDDTDQEIRTVMADNGPPLARRL